VTTHDQPGCRANGPGFLCCGCLERVQALAGETAVLAYAGCQCRLPLSMLLNDIEISRLAQEGMISPYLGSLIRQVDDHRTWQEGGKTVTYQGSRRVISYGASSYGYDLRLSPKEFLVFRHVPGTVVDPKDFNPANLEPVELHRDAKGDFFVLPGHSYGLGVAKEHLKLPADVTALFIGKSTYARAGVIANLTPGEAAWAGHLTLEFSNSSGADVRLYANEGIVQALFFRGEPCATSYEDRAGKYQNQPEQVVTARS
jgi:dCTP deaminase